MSDEGNSHDDGMDANRKVAVHGFFPEEVLADLLKSGLSPSDMKIRFLSSSERAACMCGRATRGYVIPYFDSEEGDLTDFYRVKVLNPDAENGAKYKQPHKSANRVYFPLHFQLALKDWIRKHNDHRLIVITEGEKKAACAVKHGIPCVGLGGVSSWKSNKIELSANDTELYYKPGQKGNDKKITATVHNMDKDKLYEVLNQLAEGIVEVKNIANEYNCKIVIVFDSDNKGELKSQVQLAAASLGYGFKRMGVSSSRIKLLKLPNVHPDLKMGMDDYIQTVGTKSLQDLLTKICDEPNAFPRMPDVKGYFSSALTYHSTRQQHDQMGTVVICELDAVGIRMREKTTRRPYYFHRPTNSLMSADIFGNAADSAINKPFREFMYNEFGLNVSDQKLRAHIDAQFNGEAPILEVKPRRVRCLITEAEDPMNPYGLAIQASDGKYFAVSPNPQHPVKLVDNGTSGILFQKDQVEAIDDETTLDHFDRFINEGPPLDNWWLQVLEDTNLEPRMRPCASLLFYISPWLLRWNSLQLPVEIMIGEAGSGKSSIYELRQAILTGRPVLRNAPKDFRDWVASITSTGGLVAYDNVHFVKSPLRQEISDELCRLTTERDPHVESRQLYTTADLLRIPVDATFAFTAIQQIFMNSDLFQRSIIFELTKDDRPYDGSWVQAKLDKYEGREAWMAHHLTFLHRFLRRAQFELESWSSNRSIDLRLSHFEKCLRLAGDVFGYSNIDMDDICKTITTGQKVSFEGADHTFSALRMFCDERRQNDLATPDRKFHAGEITEWAMTQDGLNDSQVINNSRKLGLYIKSNQARCRSDIGLVLLPGKYMNSYRYRVMSFNEMAYEKEHTQSQSQKRE